MRTKSAQALLTALTCLATTYIFFIGLKNIFRYNTFKLEKARIIQRHASLLNLNQNLHARLQEMNSETYWEFQARRQLGYIKPGEKTYKLVYKYKNWRNM